MFLKNQTILDGFIQSTDKFLKEDYVHVKTGKKNFDKICSAHDSVRSKLKSEHLKKKSQEKKITEVCLILNVI